MRYVGSLYILMFLWTSISWSANESAQSVTVDGVLYDSDTFTTPLIDAAAELTIQILNPAGDCVLYEEVQTVDTTGTNGKFNIQVGSAVGAAKRAVGGNDSGNAMHHIFQNVLNITGAGGCPGGTYSPTVGDARLLRIILDPSGAPPPVQMTPDMTLSNIPNALVCESVQGLDRSKLLEIGTAVHANMTAANFKKLIDGSDAGALHHHDGRYVALTNSNSITMASNTTLGLGQLTAAQQTTLEAGLGVGDKGKTWFNLSTNQIMYWDGDSSEIVGGGAAVTSIFGRTGAVSATGGDYNAGQITNTAAGNITATDVQAAIDELDTEKLALAGGTMAGQIDMNGNNIIATGHITMNADKYFHLGRYDDAEETNLVTGTPLGAAHEGVTWFDEEDNTVEYWDGTAVQVLGTAGAGDNLGNHEAGQNIDLNGFKLVGNNGTAGIEISAAGDVGIGTATPSAALEVIDSGAVSIIFGSADNVANQAQLISGNTSFGFRDGDGTDRLTILQSNGNTGIGTSSPDQLLHTEKDDASTNTVLYPLRVTRTSSGTPANSIGAGMEFEVETSASNNEILGTMEVVATDVTATAEDADFVFKTMAAGAAAAERMRISSAGTVTATAFAGDGSALTNITAGSSDAVSNADNVVINADASTPGSGEIQLQIAGSTKATVENDGDFKVSTDAFFVDASAKSIGLGTTTPSFAISMEGNAAKTVGMERHTTANTAGNNMTMSAGGATSGATDKNGGDLILSSGTATGSGSSKIEFQTATAGGAGTADRAPTTKMTILGNGNVGIGTASPTSKLSLATGSTFRLGAQIAAEAGGLDILESGAGAKINFWHARVNDANIPRGLIEGRDGLGVLISTKGWSSGDVRIQGDNDIEFGSTSGVNVDSTGGSTWMKINSSGNVGIGTVNPAASLEVNRTTGTTAPMGEFEALIAGYTGTVLTAKNALGPASSYNLFTAISDSDGDVGGPNTEFLIRGDGNVGIGTTDLTVFNAIGGTSRLVVTGSSNNTNVNSNDGASIVIANTDDTADNTSGLHFAWQDTDNTPNYAGASIVAQLGTKVAGQYPTGSLHFLTSTTTNAAPSEKMTILENGNVGIGTSSPSEKLHLETSSGDVDGGLQITNNDGSGDVYNSFTDVGALKWMVGIDGDDSKFSIVSSGSTWDAGNKRLTIDSSGNVGIGTSTPFNGWTDAPGPGLIVEGTDPTIAFYDSVEAGERWSLSTTGQGFEIQNDTDSQKYFWISNDGDAGIGTTSPTEKLHVVGNLRVQGSTDCTLGNGSGATNCSSDERLKDNITPISGALEKIHQLKGVNFTWNAKSLAPGKEAIGIIAQDVQNVFPTSVVEHDTGFLAVDYASLVAPLIQATKELDNKCEMSKAQLSTVEKRIAKLEMSDDRQSREIASLRAENRSLIKKQRELESRLEILEKILSAK